MGWKKVCLLVTVLALAKYDAFAQKYGRVERGKWTTVTEIREEEESSSDDLEPLASRGGGFDHTFKYENSFGPHKYAFEYKRDGPNTYRERTEKTDSSNYHTKYDYGGPDGHSWDSSYSSPFSNNFGHENHHGGGSNRRKDFLGSIPWRDEDAKERNGKQGNKDGGGDHQSQGSDHGNRNYHNGGGDKENHEHSRNAKGTGHEHGSRGDRSHDHDKHGRENYHHHGGRRDNGYHHHHDGHADHSSHRHHDDSGDQRKRESPQRKEDGGRHNEDNDRLHHHKNQQTIKRRVDKNLEDRDRYKRDEDRDGNNVQR